MLLGRVLTRESPRDLDGVVGERGELSPNASALS